MPDTDCFGVEKLYPTITDGRVWRCQWDNGHARVMASVSSDPDDRQFHLRGRDAALFIDGRGIARLSGVSPRMYVYDETRAKLWRNVEITFYARRVAESEPKDAQGFVVGARSEHQDVTTDHPCNARTYYGRLLYDGRADFKKELYHRDGEQIYTRAKGERRVWWNPRNAELPPGEWVGVKYVVRNVEADTRVRLELYRDRSGGLGSGNWELLTELVDAGDWKPDTPAPCPDHPADLVFTDAAAAVFLRNDALIAAEYARFSIREIAPG